MLRSHQVPDIMEHGLRFIPRMRRISWRYIRVRTAQKEDTDFRNLHSRALHAVCAIQCSIGNVQCIGHTISAASPDLP